jgi:magnesium transporter
MQAPVQATIPMQDDDTLSVETAEHHMVERVPCGAPGDTVGAMLASLAEEEFDAANAVYVLDDKRHLLGIVSLRTLLGAGMQRRLTDIMQTPSATVHPDEDQELVAVVAIERGVSEVPVIDSKQRLVGVVPSTALLKIQLREHIEDINRLAGILRDNEQASDAIDGNVLSRAMRRLPWLIVGLGGGGLATWLMAAFEGELQTRLTVAFFVPALVYLAGAIGTQSVTIAVRGLSISRQTLPELTKSELFTGMLIGIILAALSYPMIVLTLGDMNLAMAVCIALIIASTLSTTIGLLLPWTLWKLGIDPAYGSGPLATILQDLLSLAAYFACITIML